jgi:hypothetical protein
MGGTVMSTHAEDTAALLQQAADGGVPVLIPGAREMRAGHPTACPTVAAPDPATPSAPVAAVVDRDRLEHEREGGGAPSQRRHRLSRQR